MASYSIIGKIIVVMLLIGGISSTMSEPMFDKNYGTTWGYQHVINTASQVEIYMDQSSGGAGFESKSSYGSGFFSMKIKLPGNDSGGVVTAYYLSSGGNTQDELDFEFLGNRENEPITVQTNVFVDGKGDREHRVHLWFDPTADFHFYKILWNKYHIVFYIDHIPIRYFKNNKNIGVFYPSKSMKIEASIWDGSSWATDGGQTKVDWSHAPFKAYFKDFNIDGCQVSEQSGNIEQCNSNEYWWNNQQYENLTPLEEKAYLIVKHNFVTYDYCNDRSRHPTPPPECSTQ